MKELEFINTIKKNIGNDYIGDDCAFLKEYGLVISQDSLVENIHFKREWITPFQLGYKSVSVNISDILASGAEPKFLTIALSLPQNIDNKFIDEFYKGANKASLGAKIIGGDITGADKIFISITAIGNTKGRNISSRKYAKNNYIVITKGLHGASSRGLKDLQKNVMKSNWIQHHLEPQLEEEFSKNIAQNAVHPYAMMDTSDGLADALFKIAEASNAKIILDYNKIPGADIFTQEEVLFGGEDYKLVAAVSKEDLCKINNYSIIGKVVNRNDKYYLEVGNYKYSSYDELKSFNHFGG